MSSGEINLLMTIVVGMILCYIPLVCWSDIKTRTVPFLWFLPLIVVGTITEILYLLESPDRNFYLLGLTLVLCGILLAGAIKGAIGGADFWFASFIMVFVQYNPFRFPRIFFSLDFFWTLLLVTLFIPPIIYAYNLFEYEPPKTLVGKLTMYPRGVPFMVPISFAFVATLIMEMVV